MRDNDYAVSNLRTIKENVYAFATFAPNWPDGYLYDKVEAVENAIEELIACIESN